MIGPNCSTYTILIPGTWLHRDLGILSCTKRCQTPNGSCCNSYCAILFPCISWWKYNPKLQYNVCKVPRVGTGQSRCKHLQIVNLKMKIGVAREARIEMVWLGMTNPQRLQLIGNLMAHCNRHGLLATAKLRSLPFQHVQFIKEHPSSIDNDCYAQYTRCVTVSKSEVTSK